MLPRLELPLLDPQVARDPLRIWSLPMGLAWNPSQVRAEPPVRLASRRLERPTLRTERGEPGEQGMDVKGAKALSERLAEAARNVDLPPSKAVDSGDTSDRASGVAATTAKG